MTSYNHKVKYLLMPYKFLSCLSWFVGLHKKSLERERHNQRLHEKRRETGQARRARKASECNAREYVVVHVGMGIQ